MKGLNYLIFIFLMIPIIGFSQTNETEDCKEEVFTITADMPKFNGSLDKLNTAFASTMGLEKKELKKEGKIYVSVIIDCKGQPYGYKLLKGIKKSIDKRVLETLETIEEFNRWTAGTDQGEPVNIQYNIPIEIENGEFVFKTI
jgi:hypothetical protein